MDLKQPREGVAGTDRSGDQLLSLDDEAIPLRRTFIALAFHLRTAVSVGSPAPVVARMSEWMRTPRPGDYVIETGRVLNLSPRLDDDSLVKGAGYLIEHRTEWWQTDEEWERFKASDDYDEVDGRQIDEAWYIQYGPDPEDVCRWTNSDFIAVPFDRRAFTHPIGTPSPTGGVTVTRDSLLSDLADSGFIFNAQP